MPTRLRDMDARRLDLLVGLAIVIEAQVEISLLVSDQKETGALRAIVLLSGLALAVRTRAPVVSIASAFSAFAGGALLAGGAEEDLVLPFFVLFVSAFSLGALTDGRRFAIGAALAFTLTAIATAASPDTGFDDLVFGGLILCGAPLIAGRVLRSRLELATALRARTEQLEAERVAAAEAAVADERTRIAGELHDVVAHALTAMVIQASAARRLIDSDREQARQAFAGVETAGRDALTEMRRLLGVLRHEDEDLALAPQPSLTHLSTLLKRARAAGLDVALEVEGEERALPPGTDLVAYRVLQEALRSAADPGAAGRAEVRVRFTDGQVELRVVDDGSGERSLLGVHERVALYGGELVAGARREGGHAVHARLPVEAPA